MILSCPDTEWLLKLGPITRTNSAGRREQSEQGAEMRVIDDATEILEKARALVPLLEEGIVVARGCGEPEVNEEPPEPRVHSYHLPDGKWFSIASSSSFGFKVSSKRTV